MQPIWSNENNLSLIDLKLKLDNHKSKEINLGLVYRHNFDDKFILGVYNYFDHRRTGDNFSISGWTPGIEALSKYVDVRANFYLPQNKKKKIAHNNNKVVVIKGTSIYAISGGHKYEYPLKGYDIEIGCPVFGFSDELNNKFGTKLFAAKYDFRNKNTKSITGTRFRLEQPLGRMKLGDGGLYFTLNAETQYDKVTKRQNTIGLSAKYVFNDKISTKKKATGLKTRMMDKIVRDVDIVTSKASTRPEISKFIHQGKEISHIYYVGTANATYQGDGTRGSPFSVEQLKSMNIDDAMIVVTTIDPTQGGQVISKAQYEELKSLPQVVNDKEEVKLSTAGADKVEITITTNHNIAISGNHTAVEIDHKSNPTGSSMNSSQSAGSRIILLEENVSKEISEQLATTENQITLETPIEAEPVAEIEVVEPVAEIEPAEPVVEIEAEHLAGGARADLLAGIKQLPAGIVDAGVDRSNLSPNDQELYDLILEVANLAVTDQNNPYVIREKEYNIVKKMVDNAEPLNLTLNDIKNNIDADNSITPVQKTRYKKIAQDIWEFDGNIDALATNGGQQGVGTNGRSARDITGVTSLQRLQESYGIVDGNAALNLMERIAINSIKEHIADLKNLSDERVKQVASNAAYTPPTDEYKNAAKSYIGKSTALPNETKAQRATRLDERARAKPIIDEKLKSENSAVNKYMAAYRAVKRIQNDQNGLYTEKVTARFNVPEVLGQTVKAIADVKEIKHVAASNNLPFDNQAVFKQQKENIDILLTALGDSQRAYNRNQDNDMTLPTNGIVDIDRQNNGFINGNYRDRASCPHGVCVRIIDSMIDKHRQVSVSDASPASFSDEFNLGVKQAVAKLSVADQQVVMDFHANLQDVTVAVDGLGEVTFEDHQGRGFPAPYKRALANVTKDLGIRYNYLNPNRKVQLVKKDDALDIFKNLQHLDFNN